MKSHIWKWLIVALWCAGIFGLSHIPHLAVSDGASDFWLRKSAHIAEYAVLAVLIFWAIGWKDYQWRWSTAAVSWLLTVWYAVSDEWHQHFITGRNGTPVDVVIDGAGAVIGLLVVAWWLWWQRSLAEVNAESNQEASPDEPAEVREVNLDQLQQLAVEMAAKLGPGDVVALEGDLGAGKTTFVQHLVRALGADVDVSSPTFTLQKQYAIKPDLTLHHFDWYRLENPHEIVQLGVAELWQNSDTSQRPPVITVIEWPERASGLLPDHTIWISFDYVDATTRRITINH